MDNAVADASPSTAEERVVRANGDAATVSASDVEPAAYVQVCNFLDGNLHAQMLELALRNEPEFTASSVVTSDKDYRRSRVLFDLGECGARMTAEVGKILPWIYQ